MLEREITLKCMRLESSVISQTDSPSEICVLLLFIIFIISVNGFQYLVMLHLSFKETIPSVHIHVFPVLEVTN